MNYRHIFHAGNFADVMKHLTLLGLIQSLHRKPNPFCYIDTHAGIGYYDLDSVFANKSKEYTGGIEKLIQTDNPPPLVKDYLNCIHELNNELSHAKYSSLRYYPGSPMIAKKFLRGQDKIIACELHPADYQTLKFALTDDKRASIHHMDGFLGLKAFLPPAERRGIVLIDPPYEDPDEFSHLAKSLPAALKRWASGIYALWYPIKDQRQIDRLYRSLKQNIEQPILVLELKIHPDLPNHLNGSGMAIINPPWQFKEAMDATMPWVWKSLSINGQGAYKSYLLK